MLTKSQLPNPSGRPKYAPNAPATFSRPRPTSPDLTRTLHLSFKIKDLGSLTYISRKSVSRRFSWCNSQLLTPSGRRAMKETVFIPSRATRGENRLRSILATRGDELHHENRREALFLAIWVRRPKSLILNGL